MTGKTSGFIDFFCKIYVKGYKPAEEKMLQIKILSNEFNHIVDLKLYNHINKLV